MQNFTITVRKARVGNEMVTLPYGSTFMEAVEKANAQSEGAFVLKRNTVFRFNGDRVERDEVITQQNGLLSLTQDAESGK